MTSTVGAHISLGKKGEELARRFLQTLGYRIVTGNYKTKFGEIDLIAEEGEDLVFIEVKTRTTVNFGLPAEAVSRAKQTTIMQVARHYLADESRTDCSVRFDVVAVLLGKGRQPEIEVIKHAFEL